MQKKNTCFLESEVLHKFCTVRTSTSSTLYLCCVGMISYSDPWYVWYVITSRAMCVWHVTLNTTCVLCSMYLETKTRSTATHAQQCSSSPRPCRCKIGRDLSSWHHVIAPTPGPQRGAHGSRIHTLHTSCIFQSWRCPYAFPSPNSKRAQLETQGHPLDARQLRQRAIFSHALRLTYQGNQADKSPPPSPPS